MEIVCKPLLPELIIYLIVGLALFINVSLYLKNSVATGTIKKIFLIFLRVIIIISIGIILLNPCKVTRLEEASSEFKILLAIDTSKSMKQTDAEKMSRLDFIKSIFKQISWLEKNKIDDISIEHYSFDETPKSILPENIIGLQPEGNSTNLHALVKTLANDSLDGKSCKGLILFTDGRDHSGKTSETIASLAESKKIPIYSFPVGSKGFLRDVEVNINNLNSFCFAKQNFLIESDIQSYGCEFEDLIVKLYRNDVPVDSLTINTKEKNNHHIAFNVNEEKAGSYTYKIYVTPIREEQDITNNESIIFLNVIDRKIKILLLEGSPHWDTTFLQRTLQRNPKFEIDSIIQYAPKRVHQSRQTVGSKILQIPATIEEFSFYDIVILGKNIDDILSGNQINLLSDYVQRSGGIVFSFRGNSFTNNTHPDFMPGFWSTEYDKFEMSLENEGDLDSFEPMENLKSMFKNTGGPKIDGVFTPTQKKALTSIMIPFLNTKKEIVPGALYRRHGNGQVLTLGISGSWHWAFHPDSDAEHKESDIFWEKCIVWLESKCNFRPGEKYLFTGNSVSIAAGKPFDFYLTCKTPLATNQSPKVTVYQKNMPIVEVSLNSKNNQDYTGSFIPPEKGTYKAVLNFEGNKFELPFVIYGLNLEEKEVTADTDKLIELAKLTNGKILSIKDLESFIDNINIKKENAKIKKNEDYHSIWDTGFLFSFILIIFSIDWFFRRRWGLL